MWKTLHFQQHQSSISLANYNIPPQPLFLGTVHVFEFHYRKQLISKTESLNLTFTDPYYTMHLTFTTQSFQYIWSLPSLSVTDQNMLQFQYFISMAVWKNTAFDHSVTGFHPINTYLQISFGDTYDFSSSLEFILWSKYNAPRGSWPSENNRSLFIIQ